MKGRIVLHITNGESTKMTLAPSGVPGRFSSWDDILHEGPTPLASGEAWLRVRARYFASAGYGGEEEMARDYGVKDNALELLQDEDEVVFWFEHDLYDQLLLIRHLWWIGGHRDRARRFSIVIGTDYLGMLKPQDFPPRFERRQPITEDHIRVGTAAWTAYCGDDPSQLLRFSNQADLPPDRLRQGYGESAGALRAKAEGGSCLPHLSRAIGRLLEEFPSADNGLARSERQILDVLYKHGPSSAGEVCARLADAPSETAMRTLLRILEEKGHVRHRQDGPRYVYLPAVPRERARLAAINHLLQTFFDGSAESAVVALLQMSDSKLSATDFERLAAEVRKANQEGR
jgi:predicted transcriptional regulator